MAKRLVALTLLLLVVSRLSLYATAINFSGFEGGTANDELLFTGTGATISTSNVKSGVYNFKSLPGSTSQAAYASLALATGAAMSSSNMYCSFDAYVVTAAATNEPFYQAFGGASTKLEVRLAASGGGYVIEVYDSTAGSGTTGRVATGATVLALNTHYIFSVRSGTGTSANYEVKIDGVSEVSGTADQTAATVHGGIRFGRTNNRNSQIPEVYFDDIACDDAGYPLDGITKIMKVDGAGNYAQWNGVAGGATGTTYTEIDEIPTDGDSTAIEADAQNDRFSASIESTTTAGIDASTINYVKAVAVCERTVGAAGNGTFRAFYRIGGTDYDQASNSTSGNALYIGGGYIRTTDPSDSGAWIAADLDGAEAGVLDNHATNRAHCTSLFLMVQYVANVAGPGANPPNSAALLGAGR